MVMERTVLLFCHAAGLSKTAWNPIIRRVAASPLLERHPCEFVAFDWRYHGTKSDYKDLGTILFRNGDKNMPEVEHETKYWTSWAPEELYDHIQDLRADDKALSRKTRIIGIGHSMGGTSLIKLESTRSGLLDGIIVFDPVCNAMAMTPDPFLFSSKMVANTLKRQEKWNSWDEVREHFHTFKGYSRWDKESTDAFLEGGVIPSENGTYRLACAPPQEAAIYCHNMLHFTEDDHRKLGCKVIYEHAELSKLFNAQVLSEIATALPDKVVVSPAVEKVTHMMTMEDPAVCAERIIQNLPKFPVFQGKAASKL
ncbi:hypothetical protein Poli38472_008687 [Pythium oligandrum]|uniref:AB hydrolase-1 domain-containing protein n=1 Tax=Pythium oligandrum TaxID=41045 RepID=A0A8K1FCP7_PYTOL|nr:hypothetical protein Poli38472_008687 [Pythium oligandrum]|eukprot:TMW56039.1 hypothetical protein Poli38472_008687 [Pythium oligandrum]